MSEPFAPASGSCEHYAAEQRKRRITSMNSEGRRTCRAAHVRSISCSHSPHQHVDRYVAGDEALFEELAHDTHWPRPASGKSTAISPRAIAAAQPYIVGFCAGATSEIAIDSRRKIGPQPAGHLDDNAISPGATGTPKWTAHDSRQLSS
ncbi:hypothetical protein [Nonomuraea sp. NPDC049784]|uniref:hypothetical protein n=1 Tax=Nonomuraea sp. NPDC049784 TaxID=3154361 RepID=UPI0033D3A86C